MTVKERSRFGEQLCREAFRFGRWPRSVSWRLLRTPRHRPWTGLAPYALLTTGATAPLGPARER